MKKIVALASAILVAGGIAFPTAAAQAACANYGIWTYDGDSDQVKRWSPSGKLLSTVDTTISSPDIALTSDLTKILAVDADDSELKAYDSSTSEFLSSHPIGLSFGGGAGVVASGDLIIDNQEYMYSIDLDSYAHVLWADLANADSDLGANPVGDWIVPDILQLPDGDVMVLATNDAYALTETFVLRIDPTTTTNIDVVGKIDSTGYGEVWGAARAGDDIFIATESGALLKLASIPTVVSTNPITFTETVSDGGSFWGAAGSNDSTDGSASCSATPSIPIAEGLAPTGGSENVGIVAGILVFATAVAGVALRRRRRTV